MTDQAHVDQRSPALLSLYRQLSHRAHGRPGGPPNTRITEAIETTDEDVIATQGSGLPLS